MIYPILIKQTQQYVQYLQVCLVMDVMGLFLRIKNYPLQDLKKILSSEPILKKKHILGTESSPGCGPISKYQVKWSIVPIK